MTSLPNGRDPGRPGGARGALAEAERRPRRIAVVPAFNEEPTVYRVLSSLSRHPSVDELVVIDDGSTDNTRAEIQRFLDEGNRNVQALFFDKNRGVSAAYHAAFEAIKTRLEAGELDADDLILMVDADEQHDPADLDVMIRLVREEGLAALRAERDLKGSGYPVHKRLGNFVMSAWSSLWAGRIWKDVESGFNVYRVGPLIEALQFYKGHRYSHDVEVAVILSRLGYATRNDYKVPVPVFRSRTRMYDVAVDLITPVGAWWRVSVGRQVPAGIPRRVANWLPLAAFVPLALIILLLATKKIFLGTDSINNYAHVWYLHEMLFGFRPLSVRAQVLDAGDASVLPYGGAVWIVSALLWPVFHEWTITWSFAAVCLAQLWAAGYVRPAMRDPWFLFLFVINPFYIDAIFAFQYSFMFSAFFFLVFAGLIDRRRWSAAGLFGWLAASTHPIMGIPPVGLYLLWTVWQRRTPFRVAIALATGMAVAMLPVLYLMLITPSIGANTAKDIVTSVLDVVVRRGTVLLVPFVFAAHAEQVRRTWRPITVIVALGTLVNTVFANGFTGFAQGSYTGIFRTSREVYAPYFASNVFEPDATYRLLTPNEREDGMYYLLLQGGRLSSELFTESMFKQSFTADEYTCFLRARRVDYVIVERAYFTQYKTNEQRVLDGLETEGLARVVYASAEDGYSVYDVISARETGRAVENLKQCFSASATDERN